MILSPMLCLNLRPKLNCWIKQARNIRPRIRISKDRFEISVDVRNFDKEEIRVKARPEYLIIEGKQEKKTEKGFIMRQFVRKFKLPDGCHIEDMKSKLTPDGILTVKAPRKGCDLSFPCETLIPIRYGASKKDDEAMTKDDFDSKMCEKVNKVLANKVKKPEEKK